MHCLAWHAMRGSETCGTSVFHPITGNFSIKMARGSSFAPLSSVHNTRTCVVCEMYPTSQAPWRHQLCKPRCQYAHPLNGDGICKSFSRKSVSDMSIWPRRARPSRRASTPIPRQTTAPMRQQPGPPPYQCTSLHLWNITFGSGDAADATFHHRLVSVRQMQPKSAGRAS